MNQDFIKVNNHLLISKLPAISSRYDIYPNNILLRPKPSPISFATQKVARRLRKLWWGDWTFFAFS